MRSRPVQTGRQPWRRNALAMRSVTSPSPPVWARVSGGRSCSARCALMVVSARFQLKRDVAAAGAVPLDAGEGRGRAPRRSRRSGPSCGASAGRSGVPARVSPWIQPCDRCIQCTRIREHGSHGAGARRPADARQPGAGGCRAGAVRGGAARRSSASARIAAARTSCSARCGTSRPSSTHAEYVRADSFAEALRRPEGRRVRRAEQRAGARRVANGSACGSCPRTSSSGGFDEWAHGRRRMLMEDFYRAQRKRLGVLLDAGRRARGRALELRRGEPAAAEGRVADAGAVAAAGGRHRRGVRRDLDALEDVELWGEDGPRQVAATPREAEQALAAFIADRLPEFGPWQDAMVGR